LIELMVALAIVATVTTMVFAVGQRRREVAQLSNAILDVRALFAYARQEALASGRDVVVMVFPDQATGGGGTGRFVVFRDTPGTFFSAAAPVNFGAYDPVIKGGFSGGFGPAIPNSDILEVLDLGNGINVGPATGQGAGRQLLAPFARLMLDSDCTFCGAAPRRGAVVFDYNGRARFYTGVGQPIGGAVGGSLTMVSTSQPGELRTLAVLAGTGALQTINYKLP
jgi:type II secretory pathway pseudopilin PulG